MDDHDLNKCVSYLLERPDLEVFAEARFVSCPAGAHPHATPQRLDSIWILGGLGGRFDHSVATLSALYQWRNNKRNTRLVLITERSQIILLNEVCVCACVCAQSSAPDTRPTARPPFAG